MSIKGVEDAIKAMGSQQALAEACGVKQQSVAEWLARGYVPGSRVQTVSDLTGIEPADLVNPALKSLIGG